MKDAICLQLFTMVWVTDPLTYILVPACTFWLSVILAWPMPRVFACGAVCIMFANWFIFGKTSDFRSIAWLLFSVSDSESLSEFGVYVCSLIDERDALPIELIVDRKYLCSSIEFREFNALQLPNSIFSLEIL